MSEENSTQDDVAKQPAPIKLQLFQAKQLTDRKVRNVADQRDVIYLLGDIKAFKTNRPDGGYVVAVEYLVKECSTIYGRKPETIILDMGVINLLLVTGEGKKMPPNPDEGTWEVVEGLAKIYSDMEVVLILQNFAKDHDISSSGIKVGKWFEEHKKTLSAKQD